MTVTLDLCEWKLCGGEPVRGMVRVIAIEQAQFQNEDAVVTSTSLKAEQFMVPAKLWECLVDVVASHDEARAKLKEMFESNLDLAMSIVVPALERVGRRARVRR